MQYLLVFGAPAIVSHTLSEGRMDGLKQTEEAFEQCIGSGNLSKPHLGTGQMLQHYNEWCCNYGGTLKIIFCTGHK